MIEMVKELENFLNKSVEKLAITYRKTISWVRSDGGEE